MRRDKVKRIVDGKLEEAEAPLLCKLLDWDAENIAYPSGAAKKSRCVQRGCRAAKMAYVCPYPACLGAGRTE